MNSRKACFASRSCVAVEGLRTVKVSMKSKLPAKRCVRCGKPTAGRRSGRPTCMTCRVVLSEFDSDKISRKVGKLKGSHGRT